LPKQKILADLFNRTCFNYPTPGDLYKYATYGLRPEEVVLGGGNVKKLKELPLHCRAGENADAFRGGFRLWEKGDTSGHLRIRIA
jgi:hypothetical protein